MRFCFAADEQTQGRLTDLAESVISLKEETAGSLREQQASMEIYLVDALRAAHEAYLPLRVFGVFLLIVGLGCVTAASFAA